jgi:hypothetical protein
VDIFRRRFDVFHHGVAIGRRADGPLILMEQRDGADQREELGVVAARARQPVREAQLARIRIDYGDRPQQPLRVAMQRGNGLAAAPGQQAFERLRLTLPAVDGAGLLAVLVHRQRETAVEQLFVDLDGGGGEEDHHRAFDAVLMRDQAAGGRVLAGGSDRQHAFALQQLGA